MKKAHIAGDTVYIDSLVQQRCACCGELLRSIAYSQERHPGDFSINYMKGTIVVVDKRESDVLKRTATYAIESDFPLTHIINTAEYPPLEGTRYCWE